MKLKTKLLLPIVVCCCFYKLQASISHNLDDTITTFSKKQRVRFRVFDGGSNIADYNRFYGEIVAKKDVINVDAVLRGRTSMVDLAAVTLAYEKRKVTGIVTDENSEPLPGATVMEKGTTHGTTTDMDGRFSMELISDEPVLVISFIGYQKVEIPVNNRTEISLSLQPDVSSLEEVVVVGYGVTKKKDLTGSVATLGSEALERGVPTDVLSGVQGKIAGLQISGDSGDPAAGVNITIRGTNSLSAGTTPLFVIDGMPYDINTSEITSATVGNNNSSNPLSLINPADIKSVTVLKDASATSIYGSRGANGVIIIETKSGSSDKTMYSFDASLGVASVNKKMDVLNGNEFIEYRREVQPMGDLFYAGGDKSLPQDPYAYEQHDWQDEILRTAALQNYNFSLSGKSKHNTYMAGLGIQNNEAIVKNNDYQRYSLMFKFDNQKTEKLLLGVNLNGSLSEINGATQSGGGETLFNGIVQNLVLSTPLEFYNPDYDPGDVYISPSSMIDDAYKRSSTVMVNPGVHGTYEFNENIKLVATGVGRFSSSKGSEYYGKETNWGVGYNGYAALSDARSFSVSGSMQLHYDKEFDGGHRVTALAATETNIYNYESFSLIQTDFLTESTGVNDISKGSNTQSIDSYRDRNKRVSFFGRVNYGYHDKHLLTVNFRADGSDKFGPGKRWGYFPSAAYSWVMIDEGFMKRQHIFSNAKVRVSYGVSGNDRISSYSYLSELGNAYYDGVLGSAPESQANEELKWETTYQFDMGIDLGFAENRMTLTVDYYDKQTKDMLLEVPTPGQTGYAEQWRNIGEMSNKGIEVALATTNIEKADFQWTTSFNISGNRNEVLDLGGSESLPITVSGGWITNIGRVAVGQAIGRAYGYKFDGIYQIDDFTWQNDSDPSIDHESRDYELKDGVVSVSGINVAPGSFKFKDLNDDGEIDLDNDRTYISRSAPEFFGGITNTFVWKNFDATIFFQGSYGNEVFNESRWRLEGGALLGYLNVTKEFYFNHWTEDNPTNKYATFADNNVTAQLTSSYYVEDASYLRLKNFTVGYTFGVDKLTKWGLQSARVYATGSNLITWTKYSGYDPEVNSGKTLMSGVDHISYPRSRTFYIGVNVSF